MTSTNRKADVCMAPTADSKPSVSSKQKSSHADDMRVLLENVYCLHQKVSSESSQLRLQCSDLVTVNQELLDKNQNLQKRCDQLSYENEILKEELTRLKLGVSNRESLTTDNCSLICQQPEEQSDRVLQIQPLQIKLSDAEQEKKGKSLPSMDCHGLLISPKETHGLQAIEASCVSAGQPFILPDTNDAYSSSETHPKLKGNRVVIQRPDIIVPETVPMDCIEEESELLKPLGIYQRDPEISQHTSAMQEVEMGNQPTESESVSEETMKPSYVGNIAMQMRMEPTMSEPGSPVFDRFREVKLVQRKSLDSPTLFDEEEDCSLRNVIRSSGSCSDTPVRGSVVIQKSKIKRANTSFRKERVNSCDADSMQCSSPSVISGGTKVNCPKERPGGGGETNSDAYFQHCQNDETSDLAHHVKAVASSDMNAASVLLLQQKQRMSDEDHLIAVVCQRRLSRFSLKQTDKTVAKENRMSSDVEQQKATELLCPFGTNRRKRQRPSDPDETFCALGTSILENSACESTHYVAPGDSVLEHSVGESTHFIAPGDTVVLENNSPAICNLDSLATVYIQSKTSPDVQLTFSELEREIVTCVPATDLHKSGCSKSLLSDNKMQLHSEEAFTIPKRARSDSSLDSCGYSAEYQCTVQLAENCDHIDASSSVQIKLDNALSMVESPAESQASQCLLGHPSSFSLPVHESLQLDQFKDCSPSQKPLFDEALRDAPAHFKQSDMDDSFDRIPKAGGIDYAYLDVVRKQHQRRQLDAFACVQCEQWYRGLDLTDEQIKERLKTCRHKARFQPTSTPEHYWSVGFPDTQQCNERGYLNVGPISPSKHRRKKGLRILFESNKERLKEKRKKQQSLEQCLKLSNQSPSLSN